MMNIQNSGKNTVSNRQFSALKTASKMASKSIISLLIVTTLAACSSGAMHRPIVDGGDLANYEADLADCQQVAQQREYMNDETKSDATIGAVVGALSGIGESAEETIVGAIVGAVIGGGSRAYDTQDERKKIVIRCMQGRGYNVVESTT